MLRSCVERCRFLVDCSRLAVALQPYNRSRSTTSNRQTLLTLCSQCSKFTRGVFAVYAFLQLEVSPSFSLFLHAFGLGSFDCDA